MTSNNKHRADIVTGGMLFLCVLLCNGCFNFTGTTQAGPTPTPSASTVSNGSLPNPGDVSRNNVMTVTVNGSQCGNANYQYPNEPCASVTICDPGTSLCQTIDNILVDTGSFGLRIFRSVITVPLVPLTQGTGTLAECVQYGDGSSQWGAIEYADVKLAGEPAVKVPIQVVDSTYATAPGPCTSAQSTPDTDPQEAGFNGILGVGLLAQDCGSYCVTNSGNSQYYTCSGSTCTMAVASLSNQVQNPVALLPVDNNGVLLQLPSVPASGAAEINGSLIFGIGTKANNTPSGVTTYAADGSTQEFSTVFSAYSATAVSSFIDSGSSMFFIPTPSNANQLPDCSSSQGGNNSTLTGFFCPASTQSFSATNYSVTGPTNGNVSFQIANASDLINSGFSVFMNLGGLSATGSTAYFDWGLPFFYGRNVYVGFEGASSKLGTGPYWAY